MKRVDILAPIALAIMVAGGLVQQPLATGAGAVLASTWIVLRLAQRYPVIAAPLVAAFGVRAAVAFLQAATGALPDSQLDAVTFESVAAEWARDGVSGLATHFTMGAYIYSWTLSVLYVAFGRSAILAQFLNVTLASLIVVNVYLLARHLWDDRTARRAAWLAALFPILILYAAITLRESIVFYLLSLSAVVIARWMASERILHFLAASALLVLTALFHAGAALAFPTLCLVALAWAGVAATQGRAALAVRRAGPAALFLIAGLTVLALGVGGLTFARVSDVLSLDMVALRQRVTSSLADSAYLAGVETTSIFDLVWQTPLRIFYLLYSPLPWMITKAYYVVGFLDALCYAALTVLLVRSWPSLRTRPAALALLLISFAVLAAFALNTSNAGTALRHRAVVAPIAFALLAPHAFASPFLRRDGRDVLFVVNEPKAFLHGRLDLARKVSSAGYRVHVAGPDGPERAQIESLGFRYHPLSLKRKSTNPARELVTLLSFIRLYRKVRPSLVHHFAIKPAFYGGIAARLARIPCSVTTVTGLGFVFLAKGARAAVLRTVVVAGLGVAFDHPNARVFFQNEDDLAVLVTRGVVSRDRARLVAGSGVDTDRFVPLPEPTGEPTVVVVSRMLTDKGIVEFVDAARSLRGAGRFVLVGDMDPGNPSSIPRETLESWAKEGVVEWWGWRGDMLQVYGSASIVCLPSYGEGVPRALLEGAACGRPLVATDVPGCRAVVVDGENGVLAKARDPTSLANALKPLLRSSAMRARMGRNARARVVERFSSGRVLVQTLSVYAELVREMRR